MTESINDPSGERGLAAHRMSGGGGGGGGGGMAVFEEMSEEAATADQMSTRQKVFDWLRKFIKFLCSYIGLTGLLSAYVVFGAVVFMELEGPKSADVSDRVQAEKFEMAVRWQAESQNQSLEWFEEALDEYEEFLLGEVGKNGYAGDTEGDKDRRWSFIGSLLFTITIVTTIGYGHITPRTNFGRMFCIFYALVGIPLMLLVLTNVGRLFANTAKLFYIAYSSKICARLRCFPRAQKKNSKKRKKLKRKQSERRKSTKSRKDSSASIYDEGKSAGRNKAGKVMRSNSDSGPNVNSPSRENRRFSLPLPRDMRENSGMDRSNELVTTKLETIEEISTTPEISKRSEKMSPPTPSPSPSQEIATTTLSAPESHGGLKSNEPDGGGETGVGGKNLKNRSNSSLQVTISDPVALVPANSDKIRRHYSDTEYTTILHRNRADDLPYRYHSSLNMSEDWKTFFNTLPRHKRRASADYIRQAIRPPSLESLREEKHLQLTEKTRALRLANYDKTQSNSLEDVFVAVCESLAPLDKRHQKYIEAKSNITDTPSGGAINITANPMQQSRSASLSIETDQYDSEVTVDEDEEDSDIPIAPVILLFFVYIMLGAVMFAYLEDGWNLWIAIYFCFVTLTTIGFGDFVPDDGMYQLLACTLYTLLGMAITSMCLALMMDKFVKVARKIGKKIGLIKSD